MKDKRGKARTEVNVRRQRKKRERRDLKEREGREWRRVGKKIGVRLFMASPAPILNPWLRRWCSL